jgi:hypothetical protein
MKRFSPILFVWMASLIGSVLLSFISKNEGNVNESLAWMTSSVLAASLITYHFFVTRKNK